MKKKDCLWQDHLMKEIVVSPSMKLNEVFERLQKGNSQIAIVKEKERFLGIITLKKILETLVGKINDERGQLILDSHV